MPVSAPLDVDERIDSSGCGDSYRLLEECIVEADRDWRQCQPQVLAFRKCMAEKGRAMTAEVVSNISKK